MNKKAFFKLTYGLYVVTSKYNEEESGCVINTFMQVTASPPQVSITVNKENYTTELISKSGFFNVSVLLEETQMDTISNFGFQSGKENDKFKNFICEYDENGVKHLCHEIAAYFVCKVNKAVDVGTHVVFVADVLEAQIVSEDPVLTYEIYHHQKKGTTPKNAPSYTEGTSIKGYRCDVCGFIYEGETVPKGYQCPVCGVGETHFQKI